MPPTKIFSGLEQIAKQPRTFKRERYVVRNPKWFGRLSGNKLWDHEMSSTALKCYDHVRQFSDLNEPNVYFRYTPHPITVTTRIITFLVGNPYKPSFATVTGWGVDPTYIVYSLGSGSMRKSRQWPFAQPNRQRLEGCLRSTSAWLFKNLVWHLNIALVVVLLPIYIYIPAPSKGCRP